MFPKIDPEADEDDEVSDDEAPWTKLWKTIKINLYLFYLLSFLFKD